jgi:hypothetical protein
MGGPDDGDDAGPGQRSMNDSAGGRQAAVGLRRQAAVAACLLAVLVSVARAQAPADGRELLHMMSRRGHIYHTLTFVQTTRRPGQADATWYESCELPGKLRIDIAPLDSQRVIVFRSESLASSALGRPVRRQPYFHSLLYLLGDVFVVPAESAAARLTTGGFDLTKLRADTWGGRPVWVAGAPAGDSTSPLFWVDQERLYVVRMIDRQGPQSTLDARITAHELVDGIWVEKEMYFLVNGREMQREMYNDIHVNTPFEPGTFEVEPYHRPGWIH